MNIVALTAEECQALIEREATIERGLKTFYEVGSALLDIRDNRLYREGYATFEDYCQRRWQMTRRNADRLIEASEVADNLRPIGLIPATESQARPLAPLAPDEQRIVWQVVEQTAPAGKVTAAHVKSVVNVFKEVVTTGAMDNGEGVQVAVADVVKAAVTEETYERMKRQETYIAEKSNRLPGAAKTQPPITLGESIRRARHAAGLSQERLAERAGIARNYIQSLESGRYASMTVRTLAKIATATGTNAAALLRNVALEL